MKYTTNQLILEPYKGSGRIESEVKGGFATIKQKTNLVGLKLLESAFVQNGRLTFELKKESTVFFTEEVLHSAAWAKKIFQCSAIKEKFILGDFSQVVLVNETEEA